MIWILVGFGILLFCYCALHLGRGGIMAKIRFHKMQKAQKKIKHYYSSARKVMSQKHHLT